MMMTRVMNAILETLKNCDALAMRCSSSDLVGRLTGKRSRVESNIMVTPLRVPIIRFEVTCIDVMSRKFA